MSTKIFYVSEPSPDKRLPVPSGTFHPSLNDHPAQTAGGLTIESEASRILIVATIREF